MKDPAAAQPLRIEMVVAGMAAAGLEAVVARLAGRLVERGHDVGISCIEYVGELGERLREEGLPVRVVPAPGLGTILYPRTLARWFRERRPDVVHTHTGAWLKGARAAHFAGVPRTVHTIHGLLDHEPWHGPLRKRWSLHYTAAVAAVSRHLVDYVHEEVGGPREKVHLVPNGIDTHRFHPGSSQKALRSRFALSDSRVVIGHVGRFAPVKNHKLLLEAFAIVHRTRPETFLALVGDGELRPAIEAAIRRLGLGDAVGLFGIAHDLPVLYRDMDMFVLPSLAEGTSISLLEAMASGLPVVATAVGGNPDVVGDAGRLVPSGDVNKLADAIDSLAGSTESRKRLGTAARQRAEAEYSEETFVVRYELLYRGITRAPAVTAMARSHEGS